PATTQVDNQRFLLAVARPLTSRSAGTHARRELANKDARRDKLPVRLLTYCEDTIAYLQVLQGAGLAVFDHVRLLVDDDRLCALAWIAYLNLIAVDRCNFATGAPGAEALHILVGDAAHGACDQVVAVHLALHEYTIARLEVF